MTSPFASDRGGRLILRGGLANAAGFLVRFGARFGFLLVGARLFGVESLGAYAIALAAVELGVMAGGLGSRWLVFQWIDEREAGRPPLHPVLDAASLAAFGSLCVALPVAGAAWFLPSSFLAPRTALALLILAPTILLQALVELLLAATRWTQAVRFDVIGKSVVQPWVGIVAAFAAYAAGWSAAGLALSYVAASLAALGYAIWGVSRCFPVTERTGWRPSRARLTAMARHGAPTMLGEAADGVAARLDLWLIGALLGEAAAGVYGLPKQIAIVVRQVRQSVDGLFVPLVARTVSRLGAAATGAAIASAVRLVLIVQLPVLVVFAAVGAPLLGLFGAPYREGAAALLLLGVAEAVQGAFGMGDLLFTYRRPGTGLAVTIAGILLAAALAVPLIGAIGLGGAAAAILAGQLMRAAVRRHMLRRGLAVRVPLAWTAAIVAIGGTAIGVALLLRERPAVALLAGLGSFALLLLVWRRASGMALMPHGFVDESP